MAAKWVKYSEYAVPGGVIEDYERDGAGWREGEWVLLTVDHAQRRAYWECYGMHNGRDCLTHSGTITYRAACMAVREAA